MLSSIGSAFTAARETAVAILLRAVLLTASLLPTRWITPTATIAGKVAYTLAARRRRVALRNLDIAFGQELSAAERRRIACASFANLISNVLVLGLRTRRLPASRLHDLFECSPREDALLEEVAAQPFAVLASHVGDWEISHHYLALRGIPLQVVVRELSNRHVDRTLNKLRSAHGAGVIPKHGALRCLLRALRAGRSVGLLADQNCPSRERFFPFFGVPASTYTEHARLFAKNGCRVIFFGCVRIGPGLRYRLMLRDLTRDLPAPTSTTTRAAIHQRADAITTRYLKATEDVIRAHPEQYLWMHRRWKSRPDDTPWLYHDLDQPLPAAIREAAIAAEPKGPDPAATE